jgi:hypothetical protein
MRKRKMLFASFFAVVLELAFAPSVHAQKPAPFPYPLRTPIKRPLPGAAEIDSADIDTDDPDVRASLDTVLSTLGLGYNSLDGRTKADCVHGTVVAPKPGSFSPSYTIHVVRSFEQFASDTAIEASLSAGFAKFSGDVHSKFQESSSGTSNTQYLLVTEKIAAKPEINLDGAKMIVALPPASDPAGQQGFFRRCGDEYVSQVQMGGEFIALLSFTQTEEQLQQSLDVSASASTWSMTASADFSTRLSSLKANQSLDIKATQIGGSPQELPEFTLDSMLAYARKFPAQINATTAAPIGLQASPFYFLNPDVPDVSGITDNFKVVETAAYGLAKSIADIKNEQALMDHFAVPSNRSPQDARARSTQLLTTAAEDYEAMTGELKKCANYYWRPGNCNFDARFLHYKLPRVGPVIVRKLDPKSGSVVDIPVPHDMTLEVRGDFCYGGDHGCAHDGVSDAEDAYIYVAAPNFARGTKYNGQALPVKAGRVIVQVKDTDYGDNSGDKLYAIVY